jgi:enoyl-CoA hydratase/carnithine racemase
VGYETIIFDTDDAIARLRLNCPEAMNSLLATLCAEVIEVHSEVERRDDLRGKAICCVARITATSCLWSSDIRGLRR